MSERQGIARLTRVAVQPPGGGMMPPLKPPSRREHRGLIAPTGVAKLTPKPAVVDEAARELRTVMGKFATGVTVITTMHRGTIHGMTANGFLSVSLRPPLVLVSLGRCRMGEMLPRTKRYGVSVLGHDQKHFAAHFAAQKESPTPPEFSFHDNVPLLDGALAHLVCRVVDVHTAGDHELWIGEIEHLHERDGEPLLFYTGKFWTVRLV